MPLILPGNVTSATVAAHDVENSCRFAIGDSAYMHKTPTSTGSRRIFTFSSWVKRGKIAADEYAIFTGGVDANAAGFFTIMFDGNNKIDIQFYDAGWDQVTTTRVFRDPAAWYHIVVAVDTTQGTDTNRIKLYVNGVQETSLSSADYPDQNFDMDVNNTDDIMQVGVRRNSSAALAGYVDAYLAETVLIDGTAYAASDFGEFDSDSPTIWKPKDPSGLTFGTNGFYLDYKASDNLGNDANGGTDLTEVNFAAADQATDTPTNNFCVMNPADNIFADATFTQGNCHVVTSDSAYSYVISTMGVTAGKWYWEVEYDAKTHSSDYARIGFAGQSTPNSTGTDLGTAAHGYGYYALNGHVLHNTSDSAFGSTTYTVGDIISVALDLTNGKAYWAKNGTWSNSGDPESGATGTGAVAVAAASTTPIGAYFPALHFADSSTYATFKCNFGGCSAFDVSSANADADGYGAFEYAVPSGYFALCTKNLAEYGG
jgi:hypothetical protein